MSEIFFFLRTSVGENFFSLHEVRTTTKFCGTFGCTVCVLYLHIKMCQTAVANSKDLAFLPPLMTTQKAVCSHK